MFTRLIAGLLIALTVSPRQPQTCHFTVNLEVKSSGAPKSVETSAPSARATQSPRPVLEVTAGEEITISWTVTALKANASPLKDITIHSFLAREDELGQERLLPLDEAAVLETALLMDFSSGDSAKGKFEIVADEPGSYIVQVETMGLAAKEAHEHRAALDVEVKPAADRHEEADGKKETE